MGTLQTQSAPQSGSYAATADRREEAVLYHLACALAEFYGLSFADVRFALDDLPPNFLHMLDSPQGWTAVGHVVAGIGAVSYLPEVH